MRIATVSGRVLNPLSIRFLLIVILLEIFLGGGGRLVNVGPASIRMYFYVIALLVSAAVLIKGHSVHTIFVVLLGIATSMFVISSLIGKLNGASLTAIVGDVKPLLPFYSLIFFYFTINTIDNVSLVVRLLKLSGVALAVMYVITFILINTHSISFLSFYGKVAKTEEFFFRGQFAFFYKGFIYMCFGAIFYVFESSRKNLIIGLLALAIFLTFTRGFFASILLTFLIYHIFIARNASKLIIFIAGTVVAMSVLWGYYYQKGLNRGTSDSARFVQVKEVGERTTLLSSLIGHGYGVGIPSRPQRMEVVYLETFHKQGLMGLIFWFSLLFLVWLYYKRALGRGHDGVVNAFLLSVVFIYIESLSNPYLTNPIGLNMVLIALVSLKVLGDGQVNQATITDNTML